MLRRLAITLALGLTFPGCTESTGPAPTTALGPAATDPVAGPDTPTTVDLGLYRVGAISIVETDKPERGDDLGNPERLKRLVRQKSGEPLSPARVAESVEALTALFDAAGYGKVLVVPTTAIDTDQHTVGLTFEIERGRKYEVAAVEILGASTVPERRIRDLVGIRAGSVYKSGEHRQAEKRLEESGLFAKVDIRTEESPGAKAAVRLIVQVEERPRP